MIYVFNPKGWTSPKLLTLNLKGLGVDAKFTRKETLLFQAALVVCWGHSTHVPLTNALNPKIIGNKLRELEKLRAANVSVPNFSKDKVENWLVRTLNHKAGSDLIQDLVQGDYYTQKIENIKHEFRVHVFKNKSIRTGIKRPKEGAHPWIKSLERSWYLDYGTFCQDNIKGNVRREAKKAVKALGYDFGAVDIGLLKNGRVVVFEVNSAPGLAIDNTSLAYARHIKQFLENPDMYKEKPNDNETP